MAKLNGILDIEGTLGGISFYKDKETGQTFVKTARGGHSSESINRDPRKIGIKQCNIEFGAIAKIKSMLLLRVQHQFRCKLPRSVHSSFTSVLRLIMEADTGNRRGKRLVYVGLKSEKGKRLLMDFMFSPDLGVYSLFNGLPQISLVGGRCSFEGLLVEASVFPAEATHVRLHYFVVDYHTEYNYSTLYSAEKVLLDRGNLPAVLPDFALDGLVELGVDGNLRVAYIHVQFCRWHEGVLVDLKGSGMIGLRCVGVFTL
jgi:hypothetical protein